MNKEPLLLIGGGGHCKSLIDIIENMRKLEKGAIVANGCFESHDARILVSR